ncbi:MAG: 2-hydroxyacid dehydrogenase [Spirochaetales bacterium]|nr:2-hydroxyacid dehydrogenase [Spirochaetales bacterium]
MENPKIAFFDAKPYDTSFFDEANENFNYDISYFESRISRETVPLAKGFDIVCAFVNDSLSGDVVRTLKDYGVSLVALRCAGYNNVDLKAAYKTLHVVRVPSYSPHAVAEHTVAMMLALNRKTHRAYYRIRDNNFSINGLLGFDMYGKTAGIIGTGKIGKIVIKILNGFDMNIIAFDRNPDKVFADLMNVKYLNIEQVYRNADIISLHCPLTTETYHMINQHSISIMKKNVMIINTGRGQLIDSKALIEGLKNNRIRYAGLDVYEEESEYFFEDFSGSNIDDDVLARLMTINNVLITSHQAFFTEEAMKNIALTTLTNIKDYAEGNRLKNEICYKCGEENCRKEKEGRCF